MAEKVCVIKFVLFFSSVSREEVRGRLSTNVWRVWANFDGLFGTETRPPPGSPGATRTSQKCTRAWPCPPTSPPTHMTLGTTSTRRPAPRSTCPPAECRPCCPRCPTCSPVSLRISPTASAGTTAGRRARTGLLLHPTALTLRTAFHTLTARRSAATRAGMQPTRARWFSDTARGRTSMEARWCARSAALIPARTRT